MNNNNKDKKQYNEILFLRLPASVFILENSMQEFVSLSKAQILLAPETWELVQISSVAPAFIS